MQFELGSEQRAIQGLAREFAREEGWDVLRFEQLGRRLKAGAAVALMALVGGGTGVVVSGQRRR